MYSKHNYCMCKSPSLWRFGTAISQSSSSLFTSGVFAFRENRTMYHEDKYMFNPFSLSIGRSLIGGENELNMYLFLWYMVRFPRKTKTPLVTEDGKDREVAISRSPKARTILLS
jgi:hypothetical protein